MNDRLPAGIGLSGIQRMRLRYCESKFVLALHEYEGWPVRRVAEFTGLSALRVRYRIDRLRNKVAHYYPCAMALREVNA